MTLAIEADDFFDLLSHDIEIVKALFREVLAERAIAQRRQSMTRAVRIARAAVVALALAHGLAAAAAAARVVAIGDVHGAYDPFVPILQAAGLVDRRSWRGRAATPRWSSSATSPTAGPRCAR